jgi:hypothetical protein
VSDNLRKKLEVYDEYGIFLYYIGNRNNPDYYLYRELENLNYIPKGSASKKRDEYFEKHQHNIVKGGRAFINYYLLWK